MLRHAAVDMRHATAMPLHRHTAVDIQHATAMPLHEQLQCKSLCNPLTQMYSARVPPSTKLSLVSAHITFVCVDIDHNMVKSVALVCMAFDGSRRALYNRVSLGAHTPSSRQKQCTMRVIYFGRFVIDIDTDECGDVCTDEIKMLVGSTRALYSFSRRCLCQLRNEMASSRSRPMPMSATQ